MFSREADLMRETNALHAIGKRSKTKGRVAKKKEKREIEKKRRKSFSSAAGDQPQREESKRENEIRW